LYPRKQRKVGEEEECGRRGDQEDELTIIHETQTYLSNGLKS
jgi:hypothetical protein